MYSIADFRPDPLICQSVFSCSDVAKVERGRRVGRQRKAPEWWQCIFRLHETHCDQSVLHFHFLFLVPKSLARTMSSSAETSCYTVVFEDTTESPSTQELRASLEKGTDDVKIDTLRRIIVATINGNPQVSGDRDIN